MIAALHPEQERRLAALRELDILDTPFEDEYDEIVALLSRICDAPIAVVNLIDADRQWFKAETGLGVRSTPLETSMCSHVILDGDYVEIADTLLDPRMNDNPLCTAVDGLRFYAGATLKSEEGLPVGTLCVLDRTPRRLDPHQREAVRVLARQVTRLLDLRLSLKRQELLGQEIAHRVKNSLASISAIIRMQAKRSESEDVRAALEAVQARIGAITALHEELHQTAQSATIELASFLERLHRHLRALAPDRMRLDISTEPIALGSDVISALGLAINEFVANAIKHGLDASGAGGIAIAGRREGDVYLLECLNEGITGAETLRAIEESRGLGTRVIAASARAIQAETAWRMDSRGLVLELRFPIEVS